jgi:hypothetical protein
LLRQTAFPCRVVTSRVAASLELTVFYDRWPLAGSANRWSLAGSANLWPLAGSVNRWSLAGSANLWPLAGSANLRTSASSANLWTLAGSANLWHLAGSVNRWSLADSVNLWIWTGSVGGCGMKAAVLHTVSVAGFFRLARRGARRRHRLVGCVSAAVVTIVPRSRRSCSPGDGGDGSMASPARPSWHPLLSV